MRVRIVEGEDWLDTLEPTAELLTQPGHDCRSAGTAREALSIVEAFELELAPVDIGLPDLGGYAPIRALRDRAGGGAAEGYSACAAPHEPVRARAALRTRCS